MIIDKQKLVMMIKKTHTSEEDSHVTKDINRPRKKNAKTRLTRTKKLIGPN